MSGKGKREFDEQFVSGALELLRAAGYDFDDPGKSGNWSALNRVAKHLKMAESTLRGWAKGVRRPDRPELRTMSREELRTSLGSLMHGIVAQMGGKLDEASFRDLSVGFGIVFDKYQLLTGESTANNNTRIIIEYSDEDAGYEVDFADAIEVATASDRGGEAV